MNLYLQNHAVSRPTVDLLQELLAVEADELSPERWPLSRHPRPAAAAAGWNGAIRYRALRASQGPRSRSRTPAVAAAILEHRLAGRSSVEELVLELRNAELSLRAIDELRAKLWVQPPTADAIARLGGTVEARIDDWLRRPLAPHYAMLFVEGTHLRWGTRGRGCDVPVLAAMAVNAAGYREVVAVVRGARSVAADFVALFHGLRERGCEGADLFVGDEMSGFAPALQEVFPGAIYQGCVRRFRAEALAVTTYGGLTAADEMLDRLYACEDAAAAHELLADLVPSLFAGGQPALAELLQNHAAATFRFFEFPAAVRPFVAGNGTLLKSLRDIRERARTIGGFFDEATAVRLAAARLRRRMRTIWSRYKYCSPDGGAADPDDGLVLAAAGGDWDRSEEP